MADQKLSIQEYLKWYAQASADKKKEARNKMQVVFVPDPSLKFSKSELNKQFDKWCYDKRVNDGYSVTHAEIKKRLGVTDGWINNNIKPVVHWFRAKATRDKDSSSVFYNRYDLNQYLLYGCNFAVRTILIDLESPDSQYDKSVIEDVKSFKDLKEKQPPPNTPAYDKYIELLTRLQSEIPEYVHALDPARRCPADNLEVEDIGDHSEYFDINDLWACNFHTVDDLEDTSDGESKRKYTGAEMFERDMYVNGCIRIALGGYDPEGKCKKKIYIDDPFIHGLDRSKLTRVSYREYIQRDNSFERLISSQDSTDEPVQEEPEEEKPVNLSAKQQEIMNDVISGKWNNVFITGGAGTGKTLLTKSIISGLKSAGKQVQVCAPSATAALNADPKFGRTMHSTFKINKKEIIPFDTNGNPVPPKNIVYADVILIDEISMVRMDTFKYVIKTIEAAERIRYDIEHPDDIGNGSIPKQCIFIGDFFQLSPVITKDDMADLIDNGWSLEALRRGGFCFYTDEWKQRIGKDNFIQLTETFRQSDKDFIALLEELRTGCSGNFERQVRLVKQLNKYNRSFDRNNKYIELCPRNDRVKEINKLALSKLPGELKSYKSIVTYNDPPKNEEPSEQHSKEQSAKFDTSRPVDQYIIDMLWKEYHDLMLLDIKVGAKIIMTQNARKRFFNGQQGIVSSLDDDVIKVSLLRDEKYSDPIEVKRVKYTAWLNIKSDGGPCSYTIHQFPLKVAYAISIHKSQGMSLEGACIYPQVVSAGALYVALSRVKNPDNLFLADKISTRNIMTSEDVQALYKHKTKDIPDAQQKKPLEIQGIEQIDTIMNNITDCRNNISEANPDIAARLDEFTNDLKNLRRSIIKSQL